MGKKRVEHDMHDQRAAPDRDRPRAGAHDAQRRRARALNIQPARHPTQRTRRRLIVAALLTTLMLGGCGTRETADQHVASSPPPASKFAGGPVALHFADRLTQDGQRLRFTADVVAAGPRTVRVTIVGPEIGRVVEVWDGRRLLAHEQDSVFPYTVYDAPAEHPDELGLIQEFMVGDPTTGSNPLCRHAERMNGTRLVMGRAASSYRCAPGTNGPLRRTILVDQSTGLLLHGGLLHLRRVDTSPSVDAGTFSTRAPRGAKVDVVAAKHPTDGKPRRAPAFRLQLIQGGIVSSAGYDGKPYVLAFFSSDLYFDHGEVCRRCVPALLDIQQRSHGGKDPAVLAVQNGERGKPGFPLVPAGLRLQVANDPKSALQHAYGLSHLVGFAFIGSDGSIHEVIDHPASSKEISDALSTLN